jgi:hypothetical protein
MVDLMLRLENGEEIVQSWMDPRAGATQAAGHEEATSLIDLYATNDPPIIFDPAPVRAAIRLDLALINDRLDYDDAKPVDITNEPKLFISEACGNLIAAMHAWVPDVPGADKDPSKDPVDALRYLVLPDPQYVQAMAKQARPGGGF